MHSWLLAIIVLAAPPDAPHRYFEAVASAVEDAVQFEPAGEQVEDAAVLVALAARESRFNPWAVARDQFGASYGLFQIHETSLRGWMGDDGGLGLGRLIARAFVPLDAAVVALTMVQKSRAVCRGRPWEEQLAWYASGGPTCDVPEGLAASRNRMGLARRLLAAQPAPTSFVEMTRPIAKP